MKMSALPKIIRTLLYIAVLFITFTLIPPSTSATDVYWNSPNPGTYYWYSTPSYWTIGGISTPFPRNGNDVYLVYPYSTMSSGYRRIRYNYTESLDLHSLTINATNRNRMFLEQDNYGSSSYPGALYEYIGTDAYGDYEHSYGTNAVGNSLLLGVDPTGRGSYDLSGTGTLQALIETIGIYGAGSFTQSGGSNAVTSDLSLGSYLFSQGTYDLSGTGTLEADTEHIGYGGTGSFTQSGGLNKVISDLFVGNYSAGQESYDLSGTSTLQVGNEHIGYSGTGSFTQTGGLNKMGSLNLGTISAGQGSYDLSGTGTLQASNEYIGRYGTGSFTQTGGINTVSDTLTIAWLSGSTGNYTLSDGTLYATNIVVNVGGSFSFEGGTLVVDIFTGDLVNSGGTLAPGNSPGGTVITGDYTQLVDGIFEVEIGGLFQGAEYDWLDVGGSAILGGTLDVSLFDFGSGLFEPSLGDYFDILTAETIEGEFDLLTLALLGDGLKWNVSYIINEFDTDYVRLGVSQVPIPSAFWLFGSGLIGIVGIRRKFNK